jgi:hypothetical protein
MILAGKLIAGYTDAARDELARKGITVIDTENGPVWKRIREGE